MRSAQRRLSHSHSSLLLSQASDPAFRDQKFAFDKVFGPTVSQQQVFEFVGKPLLKRRVNLLRRRHERIQRHDFRLRSNIQW